MVLIFFAYFFDFFLIVLCMLKDYLDRDIYNLITKCQSLLKNDILKDANILSYFSLKFIEGVGDE